MRIPLPAKVFISYLAVIAAGALPSIYYLTTALEKQVAETQEKEAAERLRRIANLVAPLEHSQRLKELRRLGRAMPERLTLIDHRGVVVFDSQVGDLQSLDNHGARPEVLDLWGGQKETTAERVIAGNVRYSDSLEVDMLFVATPLRSAVSAEDTTVLRLSLPLTQVSTFVNRALSSFLNSQTIALSIAMLLSLVAVFVFAAPMRKLSALARTLAGGDLTATLGEIRDDEIGDVANALERLGVELRKRLASAESDRVLLTQLVEAVPFAVCVVDPDYRVVAINAAGRELIAAYGRDANAVIKKFFSSEEIASATSKSRERSDSIRIGSSDMRVIALEHPSSEPYIALFSAGSQTKGGSSLLPGPQEIEPVKLDELMARAVSGTNLRVPNLRIPEELINVSAAEAGGRLESALRLALLEVGCEKLKVRTGEGTMGLKFPKINELECAEGVRKLVAPLGGRLQTTTKGAILWLPLA